MKSILIFRHIESLPCSHPIFHAILHICPLFQPVFSTSSGAKRRPARSQSMVTVCLKRGNPLIQIEKKFLSESSVLSLAGSKIASEWEKRPGGQPPG
ncbi:MAG: hypothetical protein WBV33_05805, partial [Terracidiphilus sp.]